jgi:hypothetical protein
MASFLDGRNHTGAYMYSGDMSKDMFPVSSIPEYLMGIENDKARNDQMIALFRDRRDPGPLMESQMPRGTPQNRMYMREAQMNLYNNATFNTKDPYTDEEFDMQERNKDPRGFSGQYPWDKFGQAMKHLMKFLPIAQGGTINEDGNAPQSPIQYLTNLNYSKILLKALWKRFQDGLVGFAPQGLTITPHNPDGVLYGKNFNNEQLNSNRAFANIANPDLTFVSRTTTDNIPDMSTYRVMPMSGAPPPVSLEMKKIANPDMYNSVIEQNVSLYPTPNSYNYGNRLKQGMYDTYVHNEQEINTRKINNANLPNPTIHEYERPHVNEFTSANNKFTGKINQQFNKSQLYDNLVPEQHLFYPTKQGQLPSQLYSEYNNISPEEFHGSNHPMGNLPKNLYSEHNMPDYSSMGNNTRVYNYEVKKINPIFPETTYQPEHMSSFNRPQIVKLNVPKETILFNDTAMVNPKFINPFKPRKLMTPQLTTTFNQPY